MVYIMRQDASGVKNEGLCLKCAKELGIKLPPNVENAGEMLQNFNENMQSLIDSDDPENQGKAPMIDFDKLSSLFFGGSAQQSDPKQKKKTDQQKKTAESDSARKSINQFCINLTDKAKEGKLDRVIGREKELGRLMQILLRRQKNNPCLIGEPGTGKTAIAEALAQRIAAGTVPYKLRNKEVLLVDMTALVAGTQFRGQFEGRMKALINEVKALGNIILVIDEVHSIVGAGDAEGSMNAANILKPALSRGEIQLIGATTLTEYRKYIEKDSALERRFQPIVVEESSVADTVEILKGIKSYYEEYHRINVPDKIIEKTVELSERYITDRFLPDKAIDLLDEACSSLAMNCKEMDSLAESEEKLAKLKQEEKTLSEKISEVPEGEENEAYKRLAELRTDIMAKEKDVERLTEIQKSLTLTEAHLASVIEVWTGIPASSITEKEFDRLARLEETLKKYIVGQDRAISAVAKAIKRSRVGVSAKRKPSSFIFAGPTGVGKTELVKRLATLLFDAPESLLRFDMSEFMEKHAVSRLIGSPPGYVGYDDAGQLTEKIRRKPYSVVLFDEIEKAHPDVMNILLQILDDGQITDAQGRTVNFENTVIVMTTNAGSQYGSGAIGFGEAGIRQQEDKTEQKLSEFLRPEFLNRVDEIITFRSLDKQDFAKIAVIMLDETCEALRSKGYKVSYDEKAPLAIAENSFSEKYGARNMRRYIQTEIEDVIADKIISSRSETALISIKGKPDLSGIEVVTA